MPLHDEGPRSVATDTRAEVISQGDHHKRTPCPAGDPAQLDIHDAIREAEQRRDDGQASALHASDVRWKAAAQTALRQLAAEGRDFDAHDLRARVGILAASPNAVGALFSQAAKAGIIRPVGYRKSRTPSRAGGLLRVWRGA